MLESLSLVRAKVYGRTLDAYNGRLGTGADARTVEFVRLGRVSLMYRTLDGAEVGYWDADQKKWVQDASYRDDIDQALRVAGVQPPPPYVAPKPAAAPAATATAPKGQ